MMHVRKNDTVLIISGKDKGKKGTVIEILPRKGKVLVKGINLVTQHQKARRQGETSAIKKEESYIVIDKVMPLCSACKEPSRIIAKVTDKGRNARACSHCKEIF
jgi:large subunit ribosomal protein L24